MSCECTPYTIPKMCLNSGDNKLIEFVYKNLDGTPLSLQGATIVWTLESLINGNIVKTVSVTDVTQNTCRVSIKMPDINGSFIQKINTTFSNGEVVSDKGIVIIYD